MIPPSQPLLDVLDCRLGVIDDLAGGDSVAGIACSPWVGTVAQRAEGLEAYPDLDQCHRRIADRPAVERGLAVPDPTLAPNRRGPRARLIRFGEAQRQRR